MGQPVTLTPMPFQPFYELVAVVMEVDIDAGTPDSVLPELNDSAKHDDEPVPTPSPSAVSDSSGASNDTSSQLKNRSLPKRIKACFCVARRVMILFNNTD